jgi:hypothetical protein
LLYQSRNIEFQAELVEVFIRRWESTRRAIVELTSGEVGVVVSEYRTRRLKPKVLMLLDQRKYRLREPKMVDLSEEPANTNGATPRGIARALEPGAYDIDLSTLQI